MIKIAMFSFADINNYGDILFSHVFKMEIEARIPNVHIDFFTPSEVTIEGFSYKPYIRSHVDGKYNALILAGGEVVHLFDERSWSPIYIKNKQIVLSGNASDVVWDWADCAAGFKAWISVGVRPFGDKWDKNKIDGVINSLDYVSVRGIISKKILEASAYDTFNPKITLTPDLGWIFPQYLSFMKENGKHFKKLLPNEKPYIVFQVHNITEQEAKTIGHSLLKFKEEYNVEIVLLPVIHLWEDEKFLEQIQEASNRQFVLLPNNLRALEMADVIVHAQIVLCSSLHVAITALADGIPAGIFNKWQGTKLQDLYGLQFRTEYLFCDYTDTYDILNKLIVERSSSKSLQLYASFMKAKLSETFDDIATRILNSTDKLDLIEH